MGLQLRSLNFYVLLFMDLTLTVLAHWLAYLTRFEGVIPPVHWENFIRLLPYFCAIKLGCFFYFDLYRGMWRYTSLPDLFNIAKAVSAASILMVTFLLSGHRFYGLSRSVFLLDWLYTMLFIASLRVGIRLIYGVGWINVPSYLTNGQQPRRVRRCAIVGAGRAAEKLIRSIRDNPESGLKIVALFDDDPAKKGRLLHGLPVIGGVDLLPFWIKSEDVKVDLALIATHASGEKLRRIIGLCEHAGIEYKTVPSLSQIADGSVSVSSLREIDYKDLLGREQVRLDLDGIASIISGRTVMVTGAGGSIGSELCRQIKNFRPSRLLLLDSSEFSLYNIQMELEHTHGFRDYVPLLGSLKDRHWLADIMANHRPDVIFHAAAYKHVPMLELNPWQAVWNNVAATANLVTLAVEHRVERFVVVSTDKAVRPTNVMGASKRLTERIMQAHCGQGTRLMAVRFGNVVGSAGSVLPLFRKQIENGGPVTVTHPEVVRYFMTVEEAAQLILQAGSMGEGGEIFVLKMGQPVKIAEMAADLIRLSGKEPDRDIEIRFIGLRPGEKLFEELITEDEGVVPTPHEKIMVLRGNGCDWPDIHRQIEALEQAAARLDSAAIRRLLRESVPEYTPGKNGGERLPKSEPEGDGQRESLEIAGV